MSPMTAILHRFRAPALAVALVGLIAGGCADRHASPPSAIVASVGGQPITQVLFDYYLTQKTGAAPEKVGPELRRSLLEDLKRLKAAAEVGESRADATTALAIELQRLELLAGIAARADGVYAPPSDADLRGEYARFTAGLPATEFRVAHILMATEGGADVLIVKLQGGADFAHLAREQSADDSRSRGGDLGWIAPGRLPSEITDAVRALKPGQLTARPVHTIYGWHVIKLLETRTPSPPPFEQVKAQLTANLVQARYRQFLDSAMASNAGH